MPKLERLKIYFDACCLNRPFDDQTQERIRIETEAIILILNHVRLGDIDMIGSDILNLEIDKTPDPFRKLKLKIFTTYFSKIIRVDEEIAKRAFYLQTNKIKGFDAFHLACAESAHTEIFLTTDDEVLKISKRLKKELKIKVKNPVKWLQEYFLNENY